jgi:type 1 fimbria pilin
MKKKTIAIIALLLITSNIFSQTTNKLLDSSTVKHQFESLIDKSNNFQGYKVIKTTSLFKLQSNVLDSLSVKKQAFNADFLNSQKQLIDSLQTKSIASKRLFLI